MRLLFAAPLVAALCLGAFAYLSGAADLGWINDDVRDVWGNALRPEPSTLAEALSPPVGGPTLWRAPGRLFQGYVGSRLGPAGAHVLQGMLHLSCGVVFFLLLRRLHWNDNKTGWATAIFLAAPWLHSGAIQWYGVHSITTSLWMLSAAHLYLSSLDSTRRWPWLAAAMACTFVGLIFYELWAAGFLVFWAVGYYAARWRDARPRIDTARAAFWQALPMLVPYVAYAVFFKLLARDVFYQPSTKWANLPGILLQVHTRMRHWLTNTPWADAWSDGLAMAISPIGALCVIGLILSIAFASRSRPTIAQDAGPTPRLADDLLLAYGLFLGGRLVFLLMNAMSTFTYHQYSGTFGAAIALAALLDAALHRLQERPLARKSITAAAGFLLVLMAVTSAGMVAHIAAFAKSEVALQTALADRVRDLPAGHTVIVAGYPTQYRGAYSYLDEGNNGQFFEAVMRKLAPDIHVWALPKANASAEGVTASVMDRKTYRYAEQFVPWDRATFFSREGDRLECISSITAAREE